ncbi:MAG: DUF488 domain-containing protein [Alphaproteobacteria bacterium]|nr:DUF488 domain-containing protein [Alphaproteobacteria bacterium]
MTLWTIGYEAAGFAGFLATLREAGVETVIDVRDLPLSRRAGFSKNILAASLAEAGIAYVHLKSLGTPKEGRVAARGGDYPTFWAIFERRLATPEAEFDLARAAEIAKASPSALMCFEADPPRCHRKRVAELLAERFGFRVEHLRVRPDQV